MTRANIVIITTQGRFKFQCNSSAYPSNMMESIIRFACSTASKNAIFDGGIGFYDNPDCFALSKFIEDCGLELGSIGNFSYHYEIDFVKRTIKVWDSKTRWVKAPSNWKERGYICTESKNGQYGWSDWFKNKLIYSVNFIALVVDIVDGYVVLNDEKLNEAVNIKG